MKARYYDSEVGRFISEDPLGFEGGSLNLYVYAANNPIMFMDPKGLCKEAAGGIIYAGQVLLENLKNATGAAILSSLPGVDSVLEKRLAEHYFFGKEEPFYLTQSETDRLNTNVYTSEFNFGIGRLNPSSNGRIDVYDFDPQPWGNRTFIGEVGTRFGDYLGQTFGGAPFEVFPFSANN
jgi:uncharacterized protein RhaS with RHS repeats